MFMKFLWNKRSLMTINGLKNWFSLRRFIKKIKGSSPDFHTLWGIAEFVKCLEEYYFYNNNPSDDNKLGLHASRNFKSGYNGFKLKLPEVEITCKLVIDDEDVGVQIEIKRLFGHKLINNFKFVNNKWIGGYTDYDELLLNNIISLIWGEVITLLKYYYSKTDNYGGYNPRNIITN